MSYVIFASCTVISFVVLNNNTSSLLHFFFALCIASTCRKVVNFCYVLQEGHLLFLFKIIVPYREYYLMVFAHSLEEENHDTWHKLEDKLICVILFWVLYLLLFFKVISQSIHLLYRGLIMKNHIIPFLLKVIV